MNHKSVNGHKKFLKQIAHSIESPTIYTDLLHRLAFSHDASHYSLIPAAVIVVKNKEQVSDILRVANNFRIPITFRAAGTSLSGQSITDSVLVVIDNNWNQHCIEDNGNLIQLAPGVILGKANQYLAPYQKKIGPDPASVNHSKVGGMVANNASGMSCGVLYNTYHTLRGMQIVFADGTLLDTQNSSSVEAFKRSHSELIQRLQKLANRVKKDGELTQQIQKKYQIKNTTGYSLNALIDFTDPIDIIAHLMVGSEGTLGFVSEVSLATRDIHLHRATGLFIFSSAEAACLALSQLKNFNIEVAEFLDYRCLALVENQLKLFSSFASLPRESCALLIEFVAKDLSTFTEQIKACNQFLEPLVLPASIPFTTDKKQSEPMWKVRRGLFPAAAALRKPGASLIIEDIAFPLEYLAHGIVELRNLLMAHGYHEAIIFGHALSGNLHFLLEENFFDQKNIARYGEFMQALATLVAKKYHGSLKAEHGTGRNMANFVRFEWGDAAYAIMQEIKSLFDPQGILNPDVILSDKVNLHLQNLKHLPAANPIIDPCIECGFCEAVCPSRNLSLTPKQRIVVYRHLTKTPRFYEKVWKDYQWLGIKTCATTGLCGEKCPVGINTGNFILTLQRSPPSKTLAFLAKHFDGMVQVLRKLLRGVNGVANLVGPQTLYRTTRWLNRITAHHFPVYLPSLFASRSSASVSTNKKEQQEDSKKIVYFPSCVSRTLDNSQQSLTQTVINVFQQLNYQVILPDSLASLCCGQPFSSQGQEEIAKNKLDALIENLKKVSDNGRYPICFDTTPCVLQTLRHAAIQKEGLKIYDLAEFIYDEVLPSFTVQPLDETIAVHVTCSARRLNLTDKIIHVAKTCARDVVIPEDIECCGFAGVKGMLIPELNQSALQGLANQVKRCGAGYSTSGTCEIGLSFHSQGVIYRHIIFLLEQALLRGQVST